MPTKSEELTNQQIEIFEQNQTLVELYNLVTIQCARLDILEDKMEQANRMIAQNMIAIVRLEIANSCDAITNAMIEVKCEKTGSGTAALVMNFAGTLVMIGGNVLTGGGMSVLGAVLAAAGSAVAAAANNNMDGVIRAGSTAISTAVVADVDGVSEIKGWNLKSTPPVALGKSQAMKSSAIANTGVDGALKLKGLWPPSKAKAAPAGPPVFKAKYSRTAFIPHGAGGASAITFDVQKAIVDAYHETMDQLGDELATSAQGIAFVNSTLLHKIANEPFLNTTNMKSDLHPLTKSVLTKALDKLTTTGGTEYMKVKGSTLTRASTTRAAQAYVGWGYQIQFGRCNAGDTLLDGKALIAQIKIQHP